MSVENQSQFIIYQTESGKTKIEVRLQDETVWLSQKNMAELFQVSKSTVSEHIKHIYEEGELEQISTVRNFRTVQFEGERQVNRAVDYYNLDMIISVGYRVRSHVATRFRQWATNQLAEQAYHTFHANEIKHNDQRLSDFDIAIDQLPKGRGNK